MKTVYYDRRMWTMDDPIMVEDKRELPHDATPDEFIAAIRDAVVGLTDARVEVTTEWECGVAYVAGKRPATHEEATGLRAELARQEAAERERYETLRAKYEGGL